MPCKIKVRCQAQCTPLSDPAYFVDDIELFCFVFLVGDDLELILLIWRSGYKLVWISIDDYENQPGAYL